MRTDPVARVPESRILFLRDHATPSVLIEQGLKRNGHQVVSCQYPDRLLHELKSGGFDVMLIDPSLSLRDRISLIRSVRDRDLVIPIILVFKTNAEQEVVIAKTEGVTECVIRDRDGAYLFKIPDIVERLLQDRANRALPRTTPSVSMNDITDRIDLAAVAREVRGQIVDSQKAALVVLVGDDVGAAVQLDDPLVLIGRDGSCDMTLKDESISRFHSSIKVHANGVVTIRDLNSTNGTYVNGKRVQIKELKEGDKILLGKNTVIKYQTQDSIEKNYYDELYTSSTRDELTGIYNRRFCLEKIETDFSFARRHGLPVSVIIFDIDHFKRVNDTYGHLAGDQVLHTIASIGEATVRQEDILGRYGGEEFLVFLLDTDLSGATVLAERLRRRVEAEKIAFNGRVIRATISLGVMSTRKNYDIKELIALADKNLYSAKSSGRNRIRASSADGDQ